MLTTTSLGILPPTNSSLSEGDLDRVLRTALEEDLRDNGDITGGAIVPPARHARAELVLKEPAVVAGLDVVFRVVRMNDPKAECTAFCQEGDQRSGGVLATIEGNARALLVSERTALNLIQRLSGIASLTRRFAERAAEAGIYILDTRKTTPGMRALEKWAVGIGGGRNHRFGLHDGVLIKDNHIRLSGGISEAVRRVRNVNPAAPIEVEVTTFEELEEALFCKTQHIMLDNMSPDLIRRCVERVGGDAFVEVSGGVNLHNLDHYLIPGVNAISVGALTHSVKSIDISLEIEV